MKVVAITTFPPSEYPASSFGYNAILRFLEGPEIGQIVVLADAVNETEPHTFDNRLTVERCWHYNSLLSPICIILAVIKHKPDVIWLNLQYTLFGSRPLPMFLGLLLPACLKRLGYPIVLLLHHYLTVVDLAKIGITIPWAVKISLRWVDDIVMKSLTTADRVFTMVRAYEAHLSTKYPRANVQFVEQDLFKVLSFHPVCADQSHIVTLGYFGTYKKLEILLDAFQLVRQSLPNARLTVGGQNSPHTPGYIEHLAHRYAGRLDNVQFLGYVKDEDVPELFWDANVVCVTNATIPGSSGVLRLAAAYSRGVVVPHVDLFQGLHLDGWGVVYYEAGNVESLAIALLEALTNPDKQTKMAIANRRKAMQSNNQFQRAHLQAFRDLSTSTRQQGAT